MNQLTGPKRKVTQLKLATGKNAITDIAEEREDDEHMATTPKTEKVTKIQTSHCVLQ